MEGIDETVKRNLFSAVKRGNLEAVKLITNSLQSPNFEKWDAGFDLICIALQRKYKDLTKFLINLGFKVFSKKKRNTALHMAVLYGDLEIVDLFVQKGISIFAKDSKSTIPFFLIVKRTSFDGECHKILNYFLKNGVSVTTKHLSNHFTLTHFAAEIGHEKLIRLLKHKKFCLDAQAKGALTPLHVAIMNSHFNVASLLLKFGVNFEARSSDHLTPLRLAVLMEDSAMIRLIFYYTLRFRKNNYKNQFGSFLLYCATFIGDKEKVEFLLNAGANPNLHVKVTEKTPLHVAVENEFEDIVQLLLARGADRNLKQQQGFLPLHIATEKGNVEIVKRLLEHPPDSLRDVITSIFSPAHGKDTPSHIAIEKGYEEIEKLFIYKGISFFLRIENQLPFLITLTRHAPARIFNIFLEEYKIRRRFDEIEFQALLKLAAQSRDIEVFKFFCDIVLEAENASISYFALYTAVFYGVEWIVRFLLMQYVNPNLCPRHCLPPLHIAAQKGWVTIFKILLAYFAEINPSYVSRYFSTTLHAAVFSGNDEIVNIILARGTDINARLEPKPELDWNLEIDPIFVQGIYETCHVCDHGLKMGYTPLHFAAEEGNRSIVKMLLHHQADINARSDNNSTPLMLAVQNGNVDIVYYLLQAGADIEVPENLTPILSRAITYKSPSIVQLLVNYNAPVNGTLKHFAPSRGEEGFTPLHVAILEATAEVVEVLLDAKAQVHLETEQDFPLHLAIEEGDVNIILKLIEYGASFKVKCQKGLSPFLHAVKSSNLEVLRFFLWKKFNFERTTKEGLPLVIFAIDNEVNKAMFKFLLTCGIIVYEKDRNPSLLYNILREKIYKIKKHKRKQKKSGKETRKCPNGEIYAREERKNWMLRALLEFDWNPNIWSENFGETILHFAVKDQRPSAVDILLNFGADVNMVDSDGHTPFYYAAIQVERIPLFRLEDPEDPENDKEPSTLEIITRSFISTIVRLLATGKKISEQNRNLFRNRPFLRSYFSHCCAELKNLRATKITRNITFFNILEASEEKLLCYTRNKVVKGERCFNSCKQFPIYGRMLRTCIQRGIEKNEQIENNLMFFTKIQRFNVPYFIMLQVLEKLSLADLKVVDNV